MNFIYLNSGETTPNNIRLRTVVSDSQSIAPAVGSLAFTAWIASLAFTLGLQLVGYAPTLSQGTPLTPGTNVGSLLLSGSAPTVTATGGGAATSLKHRVIRGNDATGKDDWWISYQA